MEPISERGSRSSFPQPTPDQPRRQLLTDYELEGDGTVVHLASVSEKKRLWWHNAVINSAFIASWFLFATVLSVYNKWMFSSSHFGFRWPLFVTTLHMAVQFALAATLRVVWPKKFRPRNSPKKLDYCKKVVPTGMTTSLDVGLSNLSLRTITLSFYTMVKSSSLIFVLLFAFLFRLEPFSLRLTGVIFLIFVGVLLMVASETRFVLSGFLLVLSASASGGLRWCLTQLLLKNRNMGMDNPAATIFWLSPVMGCTLAAISIVADGWGSVFGSKFFDGWWTTLITIGYLILPGIVAFCMVMSEYYIIKRAGVVPMSIAGIAKEVTTITISAWIFGDELTPLNITGVTITVCGIGLFTYHKYRKSLDSTVPLDAHGNPVVEDDASGVEGNAGYMELGRTERSPSPEGRRVSEDDVRTVDDDVSTLLSSNHDGADDAEELRSIRSSKMHWAANLDSDRCPGAVQIDPFQPG